MGPVASKLFKKVVRTYTAGEIIFRQGDASDGIYSVQSGWVTVYKTKPTPQGPADIEIAKLGPGSLFGEMGMLDQTRRDATVKALEFTEVVIITKDMFESQMTALPPWVTNFIKILITRLRATNSKLTDAVQQLEAHGILLAEEKHGAAADPFLDKAHEASKTGAPAAAGNPVPPRPSASISPAPPGSKPH